MNSPKRPCLILSLFPHFGQVSSRRTSGFASAFPSLLTVIFRVVLHSGYPEQARNAPKRPRLRTIGRPHFWHGSASVSIGSGAAAFTLAAFAAAAIPAPGAAAWSVSPETLPTSRVFL